MRCVATDTKALVVGYGNDLRGDDGAGRSVADAIAARQIDGVSVRSVAQLTPELVIDLAGRSTVVFVDASVIDTQVRVRRVEPEAGAPKAMTHHGDPAALLSMVPAVGAQPRRAYVVSVPASDLGLGFEFSPSTEAAVSEAIEIVTDLVSGA